MYLATLTHIHTSRRTAVPAETLSVQAYFVIFIVLARVTHGSSSIRGKPAPFFSFHLTKTRTRTPTHPRSHTRTDVPQCCRCSGRAYPAIRKARGAAAAAHPRAVRDVHVQRCRRRLQGCDRCACPGRGAWFGGGGVFEGTEEVWWSLPKGAFL